MRYFIKTNFDKSRGSSKVMGIHKKFLHHQLGGSPRHKKGCTLLQSFTHKSNVTVTSARTGPVLPPEKDGAPLIQFQHVALKLNKTLPPSPLPPGPRRHHGLRFVFKLKIMTKKILIGSKISSERSLSRPSKNFFLGRIITVFRKPSSQLNSNGRRKKLSTQKRFHRKVTGSSLNLAQSSFY